MSTLKGLVKGLSKKSAIAGGDINISRQLDLTPSENKFFSEVTSNEADLLELMEEVPSFKLKDGKVQVLESDIDKFDKYISDTVSLEKGQGSRLPPSFHKGSLAQKTIVAGAAVAVSSTAFANDDSQGKYLASREGAFLTPSQLRRMGNENAAIKEQEKKATIGGAVDTAGAVASDIFGGVIEAPRQIVGGVLDATKELAQVMESIIPLGTTTGEDVTDESFLTADEARTNTGALVRGISQFVTGFLPATRALKAVGVTGTLANVGGAGAIADAFVFDPHEGRLANLIEEFPTLSNPVTRFLEAKPDDSEALGRFKNAVEGLGLGAATEGFTRSVKLLRANRIASVEKRALLDDKKTAQNLADSAEQMPATGFERLADDIDGEFIPFQEKASRSSPEFKTGSTKAGAERAQNINLNNLETTEDVDKLIQAVAETENLKINKARREVITNKETEKLADNLGMSVDDLLLRRSGEAFNAEQAVAARKILVSSGENLFKLAKKAATGSDEDVLLFRRGLSQHSAIQSQVSGATAEAGRALQSFRIQANSAKMQEQMIKDALAGSGGGDFSRAIAGKIAKEADIVALNKAVRKAEGSSGTDMLYETWINFLLSSPATHAVNVMSNSIVAAWSVGERKVASLIGKGLGAQSIPEGEATAQLKGMIEGSKDGFKLAWNTLKTGEPADVLQKIEMKSMRAITAENLNLAGTPGRFANFIGEVVRSPGRALMAGDDLFKTIGYRMELNAQAFRTATNEGLSGDDFAKRMVDIVNNPPDNIHIAAIDAGRYQTFTKELGEAGKSIQKVRSAVPGARVIIPFIRTPVNIMKYAGERTALAPLMGAVRDEIKAGGARRDLALAKVATGSTMMAVAADYALSGDITGGGPTNYQMKSILRETGWQPYSIKLGDTYYSYSRLDPIGAFIGLSADIVEISGQSSEADAMDISMAAVVAVSKNISSKTYLRGVTEFFDVMSSVSADPESDNKPARRWLNRFAGSVIPSGVAQIERTLNPDLHATYGMLDKIKSRIPGYSDELPPRRNIYGDPVVLSGGLGPDIMSPIYTSVDKKDPISDEIWAQKTLLRMPLMNIHGAELTPQMYDRYVQIYAGKENNRMKNVSLKQALGELFRKNQYITATDGQDGLKSLMIQSIFSGYRDAAKAQMMEEFPDLKNDIIIDKRAKAQALIGR